MQQFGRRLFGKQRRNPKVTSSARRPLAVESLEARWLMAGNVTAEVVGGDLRVTGDNLSNGLVISGTGVAGQVLIEGQFDFSNDATDTTINGSDGELLFGGITGNIIINLNGGDDALDMVNVAVPRDLIITTGDGFDEIYLGQYALLTPDFDPTTVGSLGVNGVLSIDTGAQDDYITLGRVFGGADWSIRTGSGDDVLFVYSASGDVIDVSTGSEVDLVNVAYLTAHGNLRIDTGLQDDTISVITTLTKQNAQFISGDGSDTVALDANQYNGNVLVDTGAGNDWVLVARSIVAEEATILTSSGNDTLIVGKYFGFIDDEYENGEDGEEGEITSSDNGSYDEPVLLVGGNVAKTLRVDMGAGTDSADIVANAVDNFFAQFGGGDDTVIAQNNWVKNSGFLNGGSGKNKLTQGGNLTKNFTVSNFS